MTLRLPHALSRTLRLFALTVILAPLAACGEKSNDSAHGAKPEDAPIAVSVTAVSSEALAQPLVRSGTLRARRTVKLYSQEEGRVEALPVFEGDSVAADAVVVRLDDRLLSAEVRKAEAVQRQTELNLQRIQSLAARKLVSADEQLRAETDARVAAAEASLLKTRLGYATIRAPFAAVVTERKVEPGDAVPRFAHLLTLSDPQSLMIDVSVSELVLPSLKIGTAVDVSIDALGATRFAGKIARIHPTVAADTRQGIVEVELAPVPANAQAGQLCRVYLPGVSQQRRSIPLTALRRDQNGEYVFVVDAADTARRVSVKSGASLGERIEILDGLADGDRVVTRGFLDLADGKRVQIPHQTPAKDTPLP
ncbi:MAG: efflux RND transporter periplasmic adaptor subunit [Gammaproteobacteria bacterium]|nr:efflux RND transporter periplasmic adaptor subunit [Gammaproteobacteria bacterium]